jgi:hypothetical protein
MLSSDVDAILIVFYDPELLCNIKRARGSVIVRANGGQIKYDHTGVLPGYGTVWLWLRIRVIR